MRHYETDNKSNEQKNGEVRHVKEEESSRRTLADRLNEYCQKPVIKETPFCSDEPPPVP